MGRVPKPANPTRSYLNTFNFMSKTMLSHGAWVCVWSASERNGPLKPRAVQVLFDRIAKDAGLDDLNLHPHVLRHSCGYALSDRGADLRVIQDYLGHKQIRHTVRYVALSPLRFDGLWDD